MRRSMTVIVAAAAIAAAVMSQPRPAEARCWGCWVGGGVAAGLIGGAVIAGWSHAYIGGPYYGYPSYFGYGYGYAPYGYFAPTYYIPPPAYYGPPPVYVQRVYVNRYYYRRYHHYRRHYY